LGVSICFESVFPQISRAFTKKGANLLVIVTNDAWYGRSPAAAQHAQMAVFRAVENRRVVLRAATSGISAIISPDGVVHHATGLYEERIITDRVATFSGNTLYTRVGDLFAMLCGVFSVIVLWRRPR
jgi:apolipoprotein N-acyltransferase